jgi:hypothetical protein
MKKIILTIGGVLALMLGGITASTASASAAAPIDGLRIGHINYDAAGPDNMANRNQEFVDIVNDGTADKNVKGLVFEDAYRHGNPTSRERACNKLVVKSLPDADGNRVTVLPAGHILRIYVGSAPTSPKAFTRSGKTIHPVYIDSPERCGYKGHFLNNNPPSSGRGAWDTVWITLDDQVESKSYQAYGGHFVR